MRAHIAADEEFDRRDVPVAEAIELFRGQGQDFKVELIEDLVANEGVETVSLYRNGPFEDLCRGPHAPSTGRIKAIKLNSVAGAYWRGDENREMLTRIYGTAFFSKKDLDAHLERIEEAKARDHRRLGPQLGLFMLRDEAPGMPFWLPNGTTLLRLIEARGPRAAAQARLQGDRDAAGARRGALAPLRATGTTTARTCTSCDDGRPAVRAAADELPRRLPRLRRRPPLLSRAAAAPGRVRQGLPQRARGRPARPAAGPRLHPGRRPRLLHRGPDHRRGGERSARRSTSSTRASASSDVQVELSTRPEKSIGQRRAVGQGRGGAAPRRSTARAASTS